MKQINQFSTFILFEGGSRINKTGFQTPASTFNTYDGRKEIEQHHDNY